MSAGASGAVFGVAGSVIAFLYLGKVHLPPVAVKQTLSSVVVFVGYSAFYGFTQSGIDNAAHLGGLATGLVLGALLRRPLPPPKPAPHHRYLLVFSAATLTLIVAAGLAKTQAGNHAFTKYITAGIAQEAGELGRAIIEAKKAVELDSGFFPAHKLLGGLYLKKELYDEAIASFETAVELKSADIEVQNDLGVAYMGKGAHDKAAKWYRKAAEQGSALAQTNLGYLLDTGRGVDEDDEEAVKWYRRAAEQEYARAQYLLGTMYATGKGVTKDEAEAVDWYGRAADRNLAIACNDLAWQSATSEDPAIRNPQKALEYAKKAVELSSQPVHSYLDTLAEAYYVNGQFDKAIETAKKAISLSDYPFYKEQLKKFEQAKRVQSSRGFSR